MTFADIAAFFDVGLNRANQFYAWGWRASLVGALITAFGVGFLYWGTRVRDRDFESQMVKFNLEASQARERAGSLEKRSAELEKETAQARLEQERLKHIVKWRILSPESLSRLAAGLQAGGTATLAYAANDPEALYLWTQISKAFPQPAWTLRSQARTYEGVFHAGIFIFGPDSPDKKVIEDAFRAAGIDFGTQDPGPPHMHFGDTLNPDIPTVFIASKMPPI